MRRRPPLHHVGRDPDYRFTLANERTFLAWLRTSLAFVAGAVALGSLAPDLGPSVVRTALIALLLGLAMILSIGAYTRWDRAERALREDRPLTHGILPRVIATLVSMVVVAAALLTALPAHGS
ncbi:MAG: YidH family protein [Pseudonocardia sp.]